MDTFKGEVWPVLEGISIGMASDANIIGGGGHTIEDTPLYAREHFSENESSQSSTYHKLLGVYKCLQAMVHVCAGILAFF
jgi:hypothetical protein